MAQKMTGALVFDERTDRYDIRFDLNSYYGGLHCGECFDVFVRGKWKPTRIEYGDNWYDQRLPCWENRLYHHEICVSIRSKHRRLPGYRPNAESQGDWRVLRRTTH